MFCIEEFERNWIDLICKAYPNLKNKKEVLHKVENPDKKMQNIKRYFERLDELHKRVAESHRESDEKILKKYYYDMYIIKEENIPETYFQNQAKIARERGYGDIDITDEIRHRYASQIIEDQKASLDKWIEYFLYDEESKSYEMWEKYWVFQGIIGLGKYNKETHKFSKRDDSTVYVFPDLEREAIFSTIKLMEEYIKNKTGEEEIRSSLGNGNFKKLYEYSIDKIMNKGIRKTKGTEGIWIKYEQGSDYHILRNSLQGYHTGWCTAAGENFAKSQLEGGDFYVYYSVDENNEAKIPRIAIRMDGHNIIGEIRGIADNQNMEAEMMPILNEKLKEFPDRDKFYKKENDMKLLTLIDNKVNNGIELNIEDLKFLYEVENTIDGFGYVSDPRINEIKKKRNEKKDYSVIYNVPEEKVAFSYENVIEPEVLIGGMNFKNLTNAVGLKLPKIIVGDLYLGALTSAKELTLPERVYGSLDLSNLTMAKGLKLPEIINGNLYLNNLTSAEGLTLPQTINGSLNLRNLTNAKGLTLPETINGLLDLRNLTKVKDLTFPKTVNGALNLEKLTKAKGMTLPKTITRSLFLINLKSAKGLTLPETINGDLNLRNLNSAKGLVLPAGYDLDKLICPDNVKEEILSNLGMYYEISKNDLQENNSIGSSSHGRR